MKRFSRLLKLNRAEMALLARTGILLWLVRIGLWVLPYERLCSLLFRPGDAISGDTPDVSVSQIVRGVTALSRYVPGATCLTQALVTKVLLERTGRAANLRIGVTKSVAGKLEAHAWVELHGRVIIGGRHADLSRYTVLRAV